jgi:hypothetical protein
MNISQILTELRQELALVAARARHFHELSGKYRRIF